LPVWQWYLRPHPLHSLVAVAAGEDAAAAVADMVAVEAAVSTEALGVAFMVADSAVVDFVAAVAALPEAAFAEAVRTLRAEALGAEALAAAITAEATVDMAATAAMVDMATMTTDRVLQEA
jgi:hypothetical protein